MMWVSGSQSWGLINFIPQSPLPFVQISSIYWKTAAKAWNWYQRWLWRNGIQISVWNISSRKTRLPFRCSRCSLKFSIGKTQRVLFHLFSNQISQKIFVNGKQPLSVFSPIFLGHKSKIVATTIANMNKLSPTLNTPALQATICQ